MLDISVIQEHVETDYYQVVSRFRSIHIEYEGTTERDPLWQEVGTKTVIEFTRKNDCAERVCIQRTLENMHVILLQPSWTDHFDVSKLDFESERFTKNTDERKYIVFIIPQTLQKAHDVAIVTPVPRKIAMMVCGDGDNVHLDFPSDSFPAGKIIRSASVVVKRLIREMDQSS
ncbi:MAG: hypothetical protein LBU13_10640 [Synergistaceae bacterium]|jgi:hypothetical protein|nr:hypothetical protein [Synergistaceae bacterium]